MKTYKDHINTWTRFAVVTIISAAFWLCLAQTLELISAEGYANMPELGVWIYGLSAVVLFALGMGIPFWWRTRFELDDLNLLMAFGGVGIALAPALYCLLFLAPEEAGLAAIFGLAGLLIIGVCSIPIIGIMYLMGVR